jgi:hypothetical protein
MAEKIENANFEWYYAIHYDECNVLTEPYKAQYLNVYERKGALIGMCIDIIIEKKVMVRGILDLMQNYPLNMV